jgi:hypothetical protein
MITYDALIDQLFVLTRLEYREEERFGPHCNLPEVFAKAPDREANYIRVPKVLKNKD